MPRGLFGRVKTFVRGKDFKHVEFDGYGSILSESLWRKKWSVRGISNNRNLFRKTIKEIEDNVARPISQGDFDTLFWNSRYRWNHLAGQDQARSEEARIIDDARLLQVGQVLQLWWKCCGPLEDWPYKFLQMVHPSLSVEQRAEKAAELKAELDDPQLRRCCSDAEFTQKVQHG